MSGASYEVGSCIGGRAPCRALAEPEDNAASTSVATRCSPVITLGTILGISTVFVFLVFRNPAGRGKDNRYSTGKPVSQTAASYSTYAV